MNDFYSSNESIIERLNEQIRADSIFHAIILESKNRDLRESFGKELTKAILSRKDIGDHSDSIISNKVDGEKHEDVIVVRKRKNRTFVTIDDIRDMQARIRIMPAGERYVVLIADGDLLPDVCQNALLKTLEEPPGNTITIILNEDAGSLIPTIRSRCVIYTIEDVETEVDEEIRTIAERIVELSEEGAPFYALHRTAEDVIRSRESVRTFLDITEEMLRDRLFERNENGVPFDREKTGNSIYAVENARRKIDRGLSTRYTINELLLKIGG